MTAPSRPRLREVPPPVTVPDDVHATRLAAHAERVAVLARAVSFAGGWDPKLRTRQRAEVGDLFLIGVALSWHIDLDLLEPSWTAVFEAAFPSGRDGGYGRDRVRDAVRADIPRYEPVFAWKCPVAGPRGGKCRNSSGPQLKWVTDMETGDWEWRQLCREHAPEARRRQVAAPLPPPSHGGILIRVFEDANIPWLYKRVQPRWEPDTGLDMSPLIQRPRLVVMRGPNGW